jgi:hypothetical protein
MAGLDSGFRIYDADPLKERLHEGVWQTEMRIGASTGTRACMHAVAHPHTDAML